MISSVEIYAKVNIDKWSKTVAKKTEMVSCMMTLDEQTSSRQKRCLMHTGKLEDPL